MTPAPTINHMNVGLKKVEYGRMVGVLSGLFVRCTIQKGKEWSANDSSPIFFFFGSGNSLLPDGTKPLPEPLLAYHHLGPVMFIWGQFA